MTVTETYLKKMVGKEVTDERLVDRQ